MPDAQDTLDDFMASLETGARKLAPGEWGLTVDAGGFELELSVAVRGELLRAQAAVLPADVIDPHQLLFWNRQTPLIAFAHTSAGEVVVQGDLPLQGISTSLLDGWLGLLVAAAGRAREVAVGQAGA